jgi:hypothetical protein
MNSISRSIFARSLMTGAASLAVMTMGAAGVRAEIVIVQGDDGAAGDPGEPGGNGEPVAANAGSTHPNTAPLNTATASGGNGGQGGGGSAVGNGGKAALRVRRRRRLSSLARRKRTPILPAVTAEWAV